jgi:hypothetical protein
VAWSTPYRIELADEERVVVEQRARSSNAPFRAVIRARIVLYAAEGLDNVAIAHRLDASRSFVSRVRKRFTRSASRVSTSDPEADGPFSFPLALSLP